LPDFPRLSGLDDLELLAIISSMPRASERRNAACEQLVARYRGLVRSCAQRYRSGPETREDLVQAGYLGLVKAITNFDPAVGRPLAAYAEPYITGEIKRYFRDGHCHIHVTRTVKELVSQIYTASPRLAQDLGRTPSAIDLARHLGVSADELRQAQLAQQAYRPAWLDAPLSAEPGAGNLADLLGADDPGFERTLGMQSVAAHWSELSAGERQILILRFYKDMTQDQIGQQLGISQMQVSRRLAHALGYLRPLLHSA
jgi:RNA polymerase sigma-B factor